MDAASSDGLALAASLTFCAALARLARAGLLPTMLRGFLLGDAREVVASAWAVEDGATARFMELFYSALAGGADAPEALRLARVALRHEDDARGFALAHPSFWAGWFVQR